MELKAAATVIALLLSACATYQDESGTKARAIGSGSVSVEQPLCPDPPPADVAECPTVTVTVVSNGFSDNFLGGFLALVQGAAGIFGGGAPTTIIVEPSPAPAAP